MFILSSTSSCLESLVVNHSLIYQNFELKVFKSIIFLVRYLTIDQLTYLEQM